MQYQRSIEEIMDEMLCEVEYQFDFEDNIELLHHLSFKTPILYSKKITIYKNDIFIINKMVINYK